MPQLPNRLWIVTYPDRATWRSGYATVCKTVYPGSIPGVASSIRPLPPSGAGVGAEDFPLLKRGRLCYTRALAHVTDVPR